jgi:hypothetical protein
MSRLPGRRPDSELRPPQPPAELYGDRQEPTPALNDTLMTIAALLGVALMVYMLARMVL